MAQQDKKMETKRILVYLFITFLITYGVEIGIFWPMAKGTSLQTSQTLQMLVGLVMFIPALGVLLTRLITKEGFHNAMLRPNLKGHIRYYVMAWFGPVLLTVLGAVVYFLIYPETFDPSMKTMIDTAMSQYEQAGITNVTEDQIRVQYLTQIAAGAFLAPILNAFATFGEEWGWRGYLLPKMKEKLPMLPMLLVNGVIWGLWHAPLTAIGHNYGMGYWGFPFTGILAMCGFCIVMGTLLSYISLRTGSVWPAVIAHGSINGFAAGAQLFYKGELNPFIGPIPTGIIGGLGFLVAAIVVMVILVRKGGDPA